MYVNGARLTRIREAPNILQKLVPCKNDPGLAAERLEQLEFLGPQRYRRVANAHLVVGGVGDSGTAGARPKIEQLVFARRVHRGGTG